MASQRATRQEQTLVQRGKACAPTPIPIADTGERLSPREIEVLSLIATGASNPAIAEHLVVSVHTVKSHVVHILGKLGVTSRTQAALRARELGIV
jgi:LuxR family transcriptional regulator, maltose regulon positive regulatory protein